MNLSSPLPRDRLLQLVCTILQGEIRGWELDGPAKLRPATRLVGDLDLDSLAILRVIVEIETALGKPGLPFEKVLVRGGQYVPDLTVDELVSFLTEVAG